MNIKKLARKNILDLEPYSSARDKFLDGILLDANENSFGSVIDEQNNADLNRYPDPNHIELRRRAGGIFSIDPKKLFFGVGSDEIIDLLIRIFCRPGKDSAVILQPTYGMYKVSCNINEVKTIDVELNNDFQINLEKTLSAVTKNTKLIFLCSPNNPTGNLLNKNDVLNLAHKFNGIVILDEAYIDFAEQESLINSIKNYQNLVVLRTFSKAWGMAGVRCGFCAANEEIIDLLMKIKSPYNINKLTYHTVLSALKNFSKKDFLVNKIKDEKRRLLRELKRIEKIEKVFESDANFILFRCKDPGEVYRSLAEKGIIIRDRSSQVKLEGCLRVTVGIKDQNNKFLEALRESL